jgi:lipopolysaccharide transport system ATP-binding protein
VRLHAARVRATDGTPSDALTVRTPIDIEFEFWNQVPDTVLNLSLVLHNEAGIPIFNTVPLREPTWNGRPFPAGLFRSVCHIPGELLNDGMHRVELYVVKDQSVVLFQVQEALSFEVRDDPDLRTAWYGKWIGAVRPMLEWRTELLSSSPWAERVGR